MREPNRQSAADTTKSEAEHLSNFGASRREFMESALLGGVGVLLSPMRSASSRSPLSSFVAQGGPAAGAAKAARIDVHYHLTPPSLIQAFGAQRFASFASNWTIDQRLMDMEQSGVSTAVCSVAPQGDPFAD